MEATNKKLDKYAILQPLLTHLGWEVLPPIVIIACIQGTIHNTSTKCLQELPHPQNIQTNRQLLTNSHKTSNTLILNNLRKLKKRQAPIPLD